MTKHLFALAALALLMEGCAPQPPPPAVAARDYNEGIAKTCTGSTVDLTAAAPSGTITMTNDGWCAVRVVEKDGKPFALGLVRTRPAHGFVLIRSLGGQTRVEYTAENRFVGTDQFTVALRSKTANVPDTALQVSVTTTMGEGMAPPPAPAPASTTRTPARRTTTPRRS